MADIKKIGVLTAIHKYGCEVVGFRKGYAGLYANDSMILNEENCKIS